MRQRLLPLLLTFYIAKREMLSFQAIQTQGIETEEDSTRRAGKPACFFARCCLYATQHTSTCIMPLMTSTGVIWPVSP